jgi:hypothetical protein
LFVSVDTSFFLAIDGEFEKVWIRGKCHVNHPFY